MKLGSVTLMKGISVTSVRFTRRPSRDILDGQPGLYQKPTSAILNKCVHFGYMYKYSGFEKT